MAALYPGSSHLAVYQRKCCSGLFPEPPLRPISAPLSLPISTLRTLLDRRPAKSKPLESLGERLIHGARHV
jgi:hypothetical protein